MKFTFSATAALKLRLFSVQRLTGDMFLSLEAFHILIALYYFPSKLYPEFKPPEGFYFGYLIYFEYFLFIPSLFVAAFSFPLFLKSLPRLAD